VDPDGHCGGPGQNDCGKITVTAKVQDAHPEVQKTNSKGSATATVVGGVDYTIKYAGKPMANTDVSEKVTNKTTIDGKVTDVKTETSPGRTGANGVVPDETSYSTTKYGPSMPGTNLAAQEMADSSIVKSTTQILMITSPTGFACQVTEQRSMSNDGSDWTVKLNSPATQTATPSKPQ
jgi:hypothetical protein